MPTTATTPAWRRARLAPLLLAACLLPRAAAAALIDFETVPGVVSAEGVPIADQYLATVGVAFGLDLDGDRIPDPGAAPHLEQRGGASWSFINDVDSSFDRPAEGTEAQLGDWFLGALLSGAGQAFMVTFSTTVATAGGLIWDIDGNPLQGTEQWLVEALDASASVLETILSPLGADLSPDGLNGKPWAFEFDRSEQDIAALRIEFVGSKTWGIGAGFESFAVAPDPMPTIPEPRTALLIGVGLAFLARPRGGSAPSR